MNKIKNDNYIEEVIKKLKKLNKLENKLKVAENTLNRVLDLINSNEELAHFYSVKEELRKPIEDFFKKVK